MLTRLSPYSPLSFALALFASATSSQAQDAVADVMLELNRVDQIDTACRLTFMARNGLAEDIGSFALETVLIDAEGRVAQLTVFDFGALPAGTPRVRQFDLAELRCDTLGRVLINGVAECAGPVDCAERLRFETRTELELIG